jgi:hypothetical protein
MKIYDEKYHKCLNIHRNFISISLENLNFNFKNKVNFKSYFEENQKQRSDLVSVVYENSMLLCYLINIKGWVKCYLT